MSAIARRLASRSETAAFEPVEYAHFETITPDRARELLTRNTRNRKISRLKVGILAAKMSAGKWKLTGQAHVIVGSDGQLLNGQHTLTAVVSAGVPIYTLVVYGIDPSAFDAIDIGMKRTAAHMFEVSGVAHGGEIAAVIRRVSIVENVRRTDDGWTGVAHTNLDNDEIREVYAADPAAWDDCASFGAAQRKIAARSALSVSASAVGAFVFLADRAEIDPYSSRHFVSLVTSDVGHSAGEPATTLRRWLFANTDTRSNSDRQLAESSAWAKAFNYHVAGQSLARMYPWNRSSTAAHFPMPGMAP